MKQIKNLYEYIDLMKTRIIMTVGERSLSALYFHVKGYEVGNKEDEKLETHFIYFMISFRITICVLNLLLAGEI